MNSIEQTLSIIKPDAVERNLIENIKSIFTKNDLIIKEDKKIHITKEEAASVVKLQYLKCVKNCQFLLQMFQHPCC